MSKRTDSIVAVTIARYATIYVEADTPEEGAKTVKDNLSSIYDAMSSDIDNQFEESEMEVDSYENYTLIADEYMDHIWAGGKALSYNDYINEINEHG